MSSDLSTYERATGWLGRTIAYTPVVGSTNDVVLEAAERGREEGFVAVADVQSSGRGRLNRRWEAQAGSALLLSILFRPPAPLAHHAGRTTMVCGLGLQAAVELVCGLKTHLKWPNDLVVVPEGEPGAWLKLAGMLTEVWTAASGSGTALVVGIGLNVNVAADQLSRIAPRAGSLSALTGERVDRVAVLDEMLGQIEGRYDAMLAGEDPYPIWRAQLAWLGQPVVVTRGTTRVAGTAEDVDEAGNLLVRTALGELLTFSAGDVSLRGL